MNFEWEKNETVNGNIELTAENEVVFVQAWLRHHENFWTAGCSIRLLWYSSDFDAYMDDIGYKAGFDKTFLDKEGATEAEKEFALMNAVAYVEDKSERLMEDYLKWLEEGLDELKRKCEDLKEALEACRCNG